MFDLYLTYEYAFASSQLALAMLGMGATLRLGDFEQVLRFPKGFIIGLACVVIVSPLIALAIGNLLPLEPGLATGLVLIGAVPGGTMSNILTYFARGNVPLSITLTGAATMACLVTTPLMLRLFAPGIENARIEMPVGRITMEITFFLLLPLFSGMAIGTRLPGYRDAIARWSIRASLGVIVLMIIGSVGAGRVDAGAYGVPAILGLFALCFTLFAVAFLAGRTFGLELPESLTVAIETSYRNTSLAILIKASIFPAIPGLPDPFADQVFFVALLYSGFALIVLLPPTLIHRRHRAGILPGLRAAR